MNDHMPNEPERTEPAWPWPPALLPTDAPSPAPKLIVPRPVYATALIDEATRRTRALHAEMVANGTAEYAIPVPLTARRVGALVHACPSGQHVAQTCYTCEEADREIEYTRSYIQQAIERMEKDRATRDVPEALRGPRWPSQ